MIRDTFDRFQSPDRGLFGDNEQASERSSAARPRVTGASDLVDLTLALHHATDKAILVSLDGDEAKAQWLPKSEIEIERKDALIYGKRKNGQAFACPTVIVTAPEWLAKDKGLI